jgi:hypothetical protein
MEDVIGLIKKFYGRIELLATLSKTRNISSSSIRSIHILDIAPTTKI